jgi:two-component system CheB/CheR fusion protein
MHDLSASVAAGRTWHGEVHNRAKDGTLYWVDTTVVPFLDGKGAPYKYLAIHHDISAQKRAEARLRSEAAFAKIAEMAAIVAHEVRNPLAGVRGGLQLLETRRSLAPAEQLMMRQMQDRLDLLDAHVTALLQYTRPRSAQMQPIAVRALLEDVARTALANAAYSGVRCEISGADAAVSGDGQMLREIFTNLLTNAADAQSRTGTIIVTVDESGDGVTVSTTDTGAGISPPLRERIFEPFFTTKPESAGLGLAIVAQLGELQGGEVAIAASSASGTTLRVKLPRAESAPAAGPAAAGQLVPLPATKGTSQRPPSHLSAVLPATRTT